MLSFHLKDLLLAIFSVICHSLDMDEINQTSQAKQPANPTPTPVNNSNKSKLIPIILGVAAIVVIAIGAYVLGAKQSQPVVQNIVQTTPISSPTPDPTANWKTYTNQKYEFQIKYPEAVKIEESDDYIDFTIEPVGPMNVGGGISVRIKILDNSKRISLNEVHKDIVGYDCNTEYGGKCENVTFNEYSALKATDFINLSDDLAFYIPKDKRVYVISTQEDQTLPNQILSTFQFLDEGTNGLRVCPDSWVEFLSPIPTINNPYYGQKGQFITINGSIDLIPAEKFDLEWIRQNCEVKNPEPVG